MVYGIFAGLFVDIELNDASVPSAAELRLKRNQFNYTAMESSGRSDMHLLQPTL